MYCRRAATNVYLYTWIGRCVRWRRSGFGQARVRPAFPARTQGSARRFRTAGRSWLQGRAWRKRRWRRFRPDGTSRRQGNRECCKRLSMLVIACRVTRVQWVRQVGRPIYTYLGANEAFKPAIKIIQVTRETWVIRAWTDDQARPVALACRARAKRAIADCQACLGLPASSDELAATAERSW